MEAEAGAIHCVWAQSGPYSITVREITFGLPLCTCEQTLLSQLQTVSEVIFGKWSESFQWAILLYIQHCHTYRHTVR